MENDNYETAAEQQLDYGQGAAEVQWATDKEDLTGLEMSNLPIYRAVLNVADFAAKDFAMIRRNGFGGSDASVLIGANPYTKNLYGSFWKARHNRTFSSAESSRTLNC